MPEPAPDQITDEFGRDHDAHGHAYTARCSTCAAPITANEAEDYDGHCDVCWKEENQKK